MQDFCSQLCADNNVHRTIVGALKTLVFKDTQNQFFENFARDSINPDTYKSLRKGPDRTNRAARNLKAGGSCDTYEAVLMALKDLDVLTPVRWSDLRRGLQNILVEEPQQHEVTRVLEKMDEIAKKKEGEPVIDYLKEERELHLVDPFFRFFIKWGQNPV